MSNLEKLDVSNLNTQNSESFVNMFRGCLKLKEIDVSNFKTKNCKYFKYMFRDCKSLQSIDMLNWDMSNSGNEYGIFGIFYGCSSLKSIKINFNKENYFDSSYEKDINYSPDYYYYKKICFKNEYFSQTKSLSSDISIKDIFKGLPEEGVFIWRKGINHNKLLKLLPESWNRKAK